MKAHRSLSRQDVLKYPSDKIALMVASEFLRAAGRAAYPEIVQNCFARARELMGILETVDLDEHVAQQLQPVYWECRESELRRDIDQGEAAIRQISESMAAVFNLASQLLAQSAAASGTPGASHA